MSLIWSLAMTKFMVAGSMRTGNTKRPPYSEGAAAAGASGGDGAQASSRETARSAVETRARPLGRPLTGSVRGERRLAGPRIAEEIGHLHDDGMLPRVQGCETEAVGLRFGIRHAVGRRDRDEARRVKRVLGARDRAESVCGARLDHRVAARLPDGDLDGGRSVVDQERVADLARRFRLA